MFVCLLCLVGWLFGCLCIHVFICLFDYAKKKMYGYNGVNTKCDEETENEDYY